jgi:hypothetical protein
LPSLPQRALEGLRRGSWVLWLALGLLVVAGVVWLSWPASPQREEGQTMQADEDLMLCQRFRGLKNDHDPEADRLLAPTPAVPTDPIAPEEVDGLDAAAYLRADISVRYVRSDRSSKDRHRFVFATKGSAAGPLLHVRSGDKIDRIQRGMKNAEIVVEVRDGKIYPIRPQVSLD